MADRMTVKLKGAWKGKVQVGGIEIGTQAEVFRTRHRWKFLVGKLLLQVLMATYEYVNDTITVTDGNRTMQLANLHTQLTQGSKRKTETYKGEQGVKEQERGGKKKYKEANRGVIVPPTREVLHCIKLDYHSITNTNLTEISVVTTETQT
jgi:hypothetical protein